MPRLGPSRKKMNPVAWLVVILVIAVGAYVWTTKRDEARSRNALHNVCEAARRANDALLNRDPSNPSAEHWRDFNNIAPVLREIFAQGCINVSGLN